MFKTLPVGKTLIILSFLAGSIPAQAQIRVDARVTTSQSSCSSCDFSKKRMNGLRLQDSDFSGSLFNNSNLSGAQIDRSNLSKAHFRKALLLRVMGTDVNMSGANFQDATLTEAVLEKSNLRNTNFLHADMVRSRFNGTDFSGANFSGALAMNADFEDCLFANTQLNHANFRDATLKGVSFMGTDFGYANLQRADMSGTDLSNANLSQVRDLKQDQLALACGNANTQLPRNLSVLDCKYDSTGSDILAVAGTLKTSQRRTTLPTSQVNLTVIKSLDDSLAQIETLIEGLGSDHIDIRRDLETVKSSLRLSRRAIGY